MTATCSVGGLLLRPQRLGRGRADADIALVDDVLGLAGAFAADAAAGGPMLQALTDSVQAMVEDLLRESAGGVRNAVDELRALLSPVAEAVQRLTETLGAAESPADALEVLLPEVERLAAWLASLDAPRIRTFVDRVLGVVERDLELGADGITRRLWQVMDGFVPRLEVVAGLDAHVACRHLHVAVVLRRVSRRMRVRFVFPRLDADFIAAALLAELRRLGIPQMAARVECVADTVRAGARIGGTLSASVSFTGMGARSVGAAAAAAAATDNTYHWYPSWLLYDSASRSRDTSFGSIVKNVLAAPFLSKSDIWLNGSTNKVMRDETVLFDAATIDWAAVPGKTGEPPLRYTFNAVTADTLEAMTRHFAWITELLSSVIHFASTGWGELGTDVSVGLLHVGHTSVRAFLNRPVSFWLREKNFGDFWSATLPSWLYVAAVGFGSLEGLHTKANSGNRSKFWLIQAFADTKRTLTYAIVPSMFTDTALSIITLLNDDASNPTASTSMTNNRERVEPIVAWSDFFFGWVSTKVVPRGDYAFPGVGSGGDTAKMLLLYDLLAGAGFGLIGGLVGALAGSAFSRSLHVPTLVRSATGSTFKSVLLYLLTLYSWKEGDTDGGRYNPVGAEFGGYPNHETSPYRLPWKKGDSWMCVQGNMGAFSHTPLAASGNEVYAYDFALDFDTEVVAMRDGVVVDWFDWVPDNTNGSVIPTGSPVPTGAQTGSSNVNFIVIAHTTADADHDKGPGGGAVPTYGVYLHGKQQGVRDVFAARTPAVAPNAIIGTPVTRGEPIMRADSTGKSFHDHVHVEVRHGPAAPAAGTALPKANLNESIPFVFKEVSYVNPFKDDGVPVSLSYYTSDNG